MQFEYIGKCASGEVTCFGQTFPYREAVEVSNPAAIAKLKNNSHFRVVEEAEDAVIIEEITHAKRSRTKKQSVADSGETGEGAIGLG